MAARTGGRTQQGKTPAQDPTTAPAGFGPATGSAPNGPPPAGPPRTGGRTQQGTQRGARSSKAASSRSSSSSKPAASSPPSSSKSTGKSGGTAGRVTEYGGGLVVAAFAWPLGLNLLQGGPSRMWGWVKAKFLNEPYAGTAAGPGTGGMPAENIGQQPPTTGPGPRRRKGP